VIQRLWQGCGPSYGRYAGIRGPRAWRLTLSLSDSNQRAAPVQANALGATVPYAFGSATAASSEVRRRRRRGIGVLPGISASQ
jgi:hypothetical protein